MTDLVSRLRSIGPGGDVTFLAKEAATRIEILERELEQAAIRFETMHKALTSQANAALIGGENCRTPLETPK